MSDPVVESGAGPSAPSIAESRFLRACRRLPVDRTPVWFMRQAGRYMAEYRAIRARYSLLEICAQPELTAAVTLQPIERLGVDAAIIFADILLPLVPMGIDLSYAAGEGPVIGNPVRSSADVERLRLPEPEQDLAATLAGIRLVAQSLAGRVPLIGFAGAPFTVASYLIEGGSSRNYLKAKGLIYEQPRTWAALMDKLAMMTAAYLRAQLAAGASAVQLFDSWAGALSPDDYQQHVLPYTQRIVAELAPLGAPVIVFGTGTSGFLELLAATGADVVGLDWRIRLDDGWRRVGYERAIQGNLDPALLFAPQAELERQVGRVLAEAGGRPGHIFNLGHGILPGTPVDNVRRVVELVHQRSQEQAPGATT